MNSEQTVPIRSITTSYPQFAEPKKLYATRYTCVAEQQRGCITKRRNRIPAHLVLPGAEAPTFGQTHAYSQMNYVSPSISQGAGNTGKLSWLLCAGSSTSSQRLQSFTYSTATFGRWTTRAWCTAALYILSLQGRPTGLLVAGVTAASSADSASSKLMARLAAAAWARRIALLGHQCPVHCTL